MCIHTEEEAKGFLQAMMGKYSSFEEAKAHFTSHMTYTDRKGELKVDSYSEGARKFVTKVLSTDNLDEVDLAGAKMTDIVEINAHYESDLFAQKQKRQLAMA